MNTKTIYPFAAIVGQQRMKLGLILNVINPAIGGVLIRGEKGTAKSTAVRALADLLPLIEVVRECPFQLSPEAAHEVCLECWKHDCRRIRLDGGRPDSDLRKTRVIELPVGATEDRLIGTLDLEHALKKGEKRIEPGILAEAHRGILYVDEVNLLDDHLVDVLLDSAAMGINTVEREGVSFTHPAQFTLVGTMNPEEGELRPQLLDRFGLCVTIEGIRDSSSRVEIMERRLRFEEDPTGFAQEWDNESAAVVEKIRNAVDLYSRITVDRSILMEIARYCLDVGVDGHRGDIVTLKAAKALAAYDNRTDVTVEDVNAAAELALPHRVRRQPLQDVAVDVKVLRDSLSKQHS
ncbi:ATP-binding protein [Desulfomonile tiedjei]|uniref:Mg-protoporphyrin IX chelatase n=1 Tax=Desulfomonile tiedjei (strain ATCC 49306 / DSM 6799 / DCB-1) TaxID=706587 RepID=I4CD05_DESTA|nr:ATP-binding protein [Desulfomonile tiedjei]AFM27446.1 Mg-chelatase subunit ChlI [Desulfomonile tiedjei DSM 6799]